MFFRQSLTIFLLSITRISFPLKYSFLYCPVSLLCLQNLESGDLLVYFQVILIVIAVRRPTETKLCHWTLPCITDRLVFLQELYRKKPGMSMEEARKPENLPKNRYRDILPCK